MSSRSLSLFRLLSPTALALSILGLVPDAGAQSAPCTAPSTPVDRTICADEGLRRAQGQFLAKAEGLVQRLAGPARQHFERDQAHWLEQRGPACAAGLLEPAPCLAQLYEDRSTLVDDLSHCTSYPFISQQALIETAVQNRLHIYAAYPRFDGSTANFGPLNDGIVRLFAQIAPQLRQAIDASPNKQDLFGFRQVYRLQCLSDVMVSLEFTTYAYGGLAHPQSAVVAVLVDLRSGGTVPPQRMFAADSHWRERVTAFVTRDLKRQLDAKGNGDAMPSSADMTRLMSEDRRYVFQRNKLAVVFDSGEIPPYSDGPRSVEIPNAVLRPFLASDVTLAD